jgi:uncharacterized protein (TIGR03000 family)
MLRAIASVVFATTAFLVLPGSSHAQFLDRWQEWGNGYGYGRSGFDIGKPGSAFSSPRWPSYYPDSVHGYYPAMPPLIVNIYPAAIESKSATIDVHVPRGAQVTFDGSPTHQTGTDRRFVSPPLDQGHMYSYRISARWLSNGQERTETRNVRVRAGQTVDVDFAP